MTKNQEKRSPITEKPLHHAGESLREEIDSVLNDEALKYLLIMGLALAMVIAGWLLVLLPSSRQSQIITVSIGSLMALGVIVYSIGKLVKLRERICHLRLGYDGERFIGEFLESLKKDGYEVIHDVFDGEANIDHVVIGPNGIYTVETKTRMKPKRGEISIRYSDKGISINGYPPDNRPLIQAKTQARWLYNFIKNELDMELFVQPVVLFPEWWVEENKSQANPEVWVLNQKRFLGYIKNSKQNLNEESIRKVGHALTKYVKSN